MSNKIKLDLIDREILLQLRRDGRLTRVGLGGRVGPTRLASSTLVKRLEDAGVITGYRAVIDPAAVGRGLEVFIDVEIQVSDLKTVEDLEATVASYDEVIELRRMFGRPDYFIRVAVADHAAYESFTTSKLLGLPGVLRVTSHLTIKKIKADD